MPVVAAKQILVACESSARVRDEFRRMGHNAWSVDLVPTEGDPKYHIQGDVLEWVGKGWDLVVAFPPCDRLTKVGARYWPRWKADGSQQAAYDFVLAIYDSNPVVALENSVGYLNTNWRPPNQIVHPWWFGDPWKKMTCLWLKGLPELVADNPVEPLGSWVDGGWSGKGEQRTHGKVRNKQDRSRTFPGVARAMAEQWG